MWSHLGIESPGVLNYLFKKRVSKDYIYILKIESRE